MRVVAPSETPSIVQLGHRSLAIIERYWRRKNTPQIVVKQAPAGWSAAAPTSSPTSAAVPLWKSGVRLSKGVLKRFEARHDTLPQAASSDRRGARTASNRVRIRESGCSRVGETGVWAWDDRKALAHLKPWLLRTRSKVRIGLEKRPRVAPYTSETRIAKGQAPGGAQGEPASGLRAARARTRNCSLRVAGSETQTELASSHARERERERERERARVRRAAHL